MLHFISFGSGSSGNCSLIFSEKEGLLIDAGIGVRILKKHLKNYGLNISNIRSILVTHDHADHVKSVGSVSKDYHIPVYATRKVHEGIEENWCVRTKVPQDMSFVVEKGRPFHVGGFTITAFGVPHDSKDNVGYCIEAEGVIFVLMTDIGHFTDEMLEYVGRANYLVIEADYEKAMLEAGPYPEELKRRIQSSLGHTSNFDCGQVLAHYATPALKGVWLCHLSDTNNQPELAEKTVKQVLRASGIVAGNDPGADFTLNALHRKLPTGVFGLK